MANLLSAIDYILFCGLLLCSAGIGVYFALTGGKQRTTSEWLMGNKELHWLPAAASLIVSFTSAVTLLGTPAEVYKNGVMFTLYALLSLVVVPFTAHVIVPFFRRLSTASMFNYIQLRFNSTVKVTTVFIFLIQMTSYLSIVLYAPALALSAVTGLSLHLTIFSTGCICVAYTVFGGIKAVIWSDALQGILMAIGVILVLVVGTITVGGPLAIYEVAKAGHRLDIDWRIDPTIRHTIPAIFIGGFFHMVCISSCNQVMIQRYVSLRTNTEARKAVYFTLPMYFLITFLTGYLGLLIFTYFATCDPLANQTISKSDQILPLLIVRLFNTIPGFTGIFVCAIFSGSLSTISSGVNSIGCVIIEDIMPLLFPITMSSISDSKKAFYAKLSALGFGFAAIALSFSMVYIGPIIQSSLSILGVFNGPVLGVFFLGMFSRRANSFGALCGLFLSLSVNLFLMLGKTVSKFSTHSPPLINSNCSDMAPFQKVDVLNFALKDYNPKTEINYSMFSLEYLFRLSYFWYSAIGVCVTFFVGYTVSLFGNSMDIKDSKLIFSVKSKEEKLGVSEV